MRRAGSEPPYLTFSEDWAYAFVERTPLTATRAEVLAWLDRRLRDLERPPVPSIRRWIPVLAQVTGLEVWDEARGRRLARRTGTARVLWRVDVSCALELQLPPESRSRRLLHGLGHLHGRGLLGEAELGRARLLCAAIEKAERERLRGQARRPIDAPRVPLEPAASQLLARLVLILMDALGVNPGDRSDDVSQSLRGIQRRLEDDEERQVRDLRAALEAREIAPRPA